MSGRLADYLPDFGPPAPAPSPFQAGAAPAFDPETVFGLDEAAPGPDLEQIAADAFKKGRLEAFEESAALHHADLEIERARHRDEVESLRTRYEQEYATLIATRFDAMSTLLTGIVGAQVAETLAPLLDETIRRRVVERLASVIMESMSDGETAQIAVAGPAALQADLTRHFAERQVDFTFEETDELDLTVEFNGTVFTTRLAEWTEALQEALA